MLDDREEDNRSMKLSVSRFDYNEAPRYLRRAEPHRLAAGAIALRGKDTEGDCHRDGMFSR